ncbi:TPA: hypothetical protein LAP77_003063 [Escherichia coli]|nr:hypothetical protein [Escherichia coli]HBJ0986195.1 hypothetical protein [Escherichia coli]
MNTIGFNLIKKCIIGFAGIILIMKGGYGADENSASILVPLTLINTQPTCALSFSGAGLNSKGGVYQLGVLKAGEEKKHPPFNINVECKDTYGTINTALTASASNPVLDKYHVKMAVDGKYNDSVPVLWLELEGKPVPVNKEQFCQRTNLNRYTCTLTPYTRVPSDSPRGEVSAVVVFDITYT